MKIIKEREEVTPNLDAIRLWEQALRSDEFTQGAGRLGFHRAVLSELGIPKPANSFESCCLGVLCEIAIRNGVDVLREVSYSYAAHGYVIKYDGERDLLPESVRKWAGIHSKNPKLHLPLTEDLVEDIFGYADSHEKDRLLAEGLSERAACCNDGDMDNCFRALTFQEIADAIRHTYLRQAQEEAHAEDS